MKFKKGFLGLTQREPTGLLYGLKMVIT